MLPLRLNNPLAPAAYNGLSSITADFEDGDFSKANNYVIPLAYGQLLNQPLQLDRDADYLLTAIYGVAGEFAIRIYDQSGYYLSDNYWIPPAVNNSGIPPVLLPIPMRFARGSSILIDLLDTSGSPDNSVTILCRGMKHFTRQ